MPNYLAGAYHETAWFRADTQAVARKLAYQHFIELGYDGKYAKRVTMKDIKITPEEKLRDRPSA